jgi:putative transposase
MKAHQAEFKITRMAEVLGLSRSGYYDWLARQPSDRLATDAELLGRVRQAHLASRGVYGAPRIHAFLRRQGVRVGRKRVARVMREAGIVGVTRRRKWRTTQRDRRARPAPDLVNREFRADGPNKLWVADITQIPTRGAPLYLAMILDVWSRKVVGTAIGDAMPAELVVRALDQAFIRRRPNGVIHHSDQGAQYTSLAFTKRCRAFNVRVSMGSVGDCYDNAMAESFFATLEAELFGIVPVFATRQECERAVFWFIEGFYNTTRLHSALGYRSPNEFESAHLSKAVHSNPQAVSLPPDPPRSPPGGIASA